MRAVKAVFVSAIALAAQAALAHDDVSHGTTFDFYLNGGSLVDTTSSTPHYTVDGIDLTVKAYVGSTQGLVDIRWDGLGVTNNNWLNSGDITKGESLVLTFSKPVTLGSISLSLWEDGLFDSIDHATLSFGGKTIDLGNCNDGLLVKSFDLKEAVGTTFTLSGTGLLTDFRLAGLQLANPNCGPVPEPATYALMGLGLVGVGLAARRRRAG